MRYQENQRKNESPVSFKNPEAQLAYQRKWMQERRIAFFLGKSCICGSTEKLMLVCKTEGARAPDAHFFSRTEKYRNQISKRFWIKCTPCGHKIICERKRSRYLGKKGDANALAHHDVWAIRGRLLGKESARLIAADYGLNHRSVSAIQHGEIWTHLQASRRQVVGCKAIKAVAHPRKKKNKKR